MREWVDVHGKQRVQPLLLFGDMSIPRRCPRASDSAFHNEKSESRRVGLLLRLGAVNWTVDQRIAID
jgi:hypothetical protein